MLLSILSFVVGWVMFAYNTDDGCDPLAAGYISNPNQVMCTIGLHTQNQSAHWTAKELEIFLQCPQKSVSELKVSFHANCILWAKFRVGFPMKVYNDCNHLLNMMIWTSLPN